MPLCVEVKAAVVLLASGFTRALDLFLPLPSARARMAASDVLLHRTPEGCITASFQHVCNDGV